MKKIILYSLITSMIVSAFAGIMGLSAQAAPVSVPLEKTVVGYYTSWASAKGYTPLHVPAQKLTHLNYAFAGIDPAANSIALANPQRDLKNFEQLRSLKAANPGLKTLISVGGWDDSVYFSAVAATEESRNSFAESCRAFLVAHGFDGVDLDWEYPVSGGKTGNLSSSGDTGNFTLLLSAIRQKLNEQSLIDGKQYYLTIAGAANPNYLKKIEAGKVAELVDHIFVMTYDMHGPWDSRSDFGAPLYSPSEYSPQYKNSVFEGISAYLNAGIPAGKLVLGIPFYGYLYEGVSENNNGRYSAFSSARAVTYDAVKNNYLNRPGFRSFYHEEAFVPYLYGNAAFLSYEDTRSVGAKVMLARKLGLAGAGIWELSQDTGGELLESVYAGVNGK